MDVDPNLEKNDPVNHPAHYTRFDAEVIEITRHLDFDSGNAIKYIARAGFKDVTKELEDLKKAEWYLNDRIKMVEKKIKSSGDKSAMVVTESRTGFVRE